jgi:putative outer membrane protein
VRRKMSKELNEEYEKEMIYGEGIDEEFTTDGELHEEKFLNKTFGYTDTENSFRIEKNGVEYKLIKNIYDEENETEKEEEQKLSLYKDVYLIDENELVYAYDTKYEKLVFLNKENDFKIIYVADE